MARTTVEACVRLDVRDLAREGLLNGDHWSTSWDSMSIEVLGDAVWIRHPSGGALSLQALQLTRTRCHWDRWRPWFLCPICGKRFAVLHRLRRLFACRRCHGLAYRTQQEEPDGRLLLKAERLWNRLGCDFGDEPEKPKWMQWRTFNRIADRAAAAYEASLFAGRFAQRMLRMMDRS